MKKSLFYCGFLLLCSCEPINLNQQQVSTSSDVYLCQLANKFLSNNTEFLVENEIFRRGVDCHPHHYQCISYGLHKGTKEYSDCRLQLNGQQFELERIDKTLNGLKRIEETTKRIEATTENRNLNAH